MREGKNVESPWSSFRRNSERIDNRDCLYPWELAARRLSSAVIRRFYHFLVIIIASRRCRKGKYVHRGNFEFHRWKTWRPLFPHFRPASLLCRFCSSFRFSEKPGVSLSLSLSLSLRRITTTMLKIVDNLNVVKECIRSHFNHLRTTDCGP